jgi:hypothetical protein
MKRLLLIALMAGGLAFVPAQRSDAQVSVGIGFGYPSYGYRYYPSYGYGITRMDTTDLIDTTVILQLLLLLAQWASSLPTPSLSPSLQSLLI